MSTQTVVIFPRRVEVVQAEARSIDWAKRRIETEERAVPYDHLVIALGAELAPEAIPGLAEGAHTFYTLEGAERLQGALRGFVGGTVAVVVSAMPYKCPGAPHEGAMLLGDYFRRRGLRGKVDLHLFTPEPQAMPAAGPELGAAVSGMLDSRGIAFHPSHKLTAVHPEARELAFEGKPAARYDLLVAIPPHRGPRLVREAGLTNEAGWVAVDRRTLATPRERVYAIGDVTAIPIPGRWKPDVPLMLPKAGVFAHEHARVVAQRIAAEILGTAGQQDFCGDGYCMLEAGEDLAGFAFGNFFAEPAPEIRLRRVGRAWHLGKVLFERWWLMPAGLRRQALELALKAGASAMASVSRFKTAASARRLQDIQVMRRIRAPSRREHLDRRDFFRVTGRLGLGSLLVAEAAALADCGGSARSTTAPGAPAPDLASTVTRPSEIGGGALVASVGTQSIWSGATTAVWTLGGSFPGPTVRVGRGARFSAQIENRLSEPTNVHWHGLASPPEMDGHPSDVIAPGQSRDIAFPIVDRAGTYWYHPHPDRRTARQVYGGMAGFFIVEDGREAALGLPSGEYDVPLVLQDRRTSPDHSLAYTPGPMDLMAGVLGDTVLVNGKPDAVLPVAATLYRLRLLNGSNARVYRLAFADGRSFHVIGTDGGLLERAVSVTGVDLGPGERVELLVNLTRDPVGTSILLSSLAFAVPGGMGGGMMPGMGGSGVAQGTTLQVLRLRVERSGPAARVPETLVPLERLDPARAEGTQAFILAMGMPPVAGAFTINGRSFDARRVDVRARRGRLELWDVRNVSSEPHPFHVHGTSFQVVSRTSGSLGAQDLGWKDTVLTWPGEAVTLAIRFEQYAGLYVLHCHNLEHEDAGMMLNLEVS